MRLNLTHTDVHTLRAGATAAEGALAREGRAQGRVVLAKELLQRRLEWLAAYEHDTAKRIEEASGDAEGARVRARVAQRRKASPGQWGAMTIPMRVCESCLVVGWVAWLGACVVWGEVRARVAIDVRGA